MTQISSRVTKLPLDFPVEYKGALVNELKVRRPKGGDMRFLPKGEDASIEGMYPFFALLAGVEEPLLDELDAADITALGELVNSFMIKPKRKK